MVFFGLYSLLKKSILLSGILHMPILASIFATENSDTATSEPVKRLNRVVFPTEGSPTIPIFIFDNKTACLVFQLLSLYVFHCITI